MATRRQFLAMLGMLPLCGWLRPRPEALPELPALTPESVIGWTNYNARWTLLSEAEILDRMRAARAHHVMQPPLTESSHRPLFDR